MTKALTIMIIGLLAGAMIAHARYQPIFNERDRIEAGEEVYRQSAVIGWVVMDRVTKQLYFVEK